MPRSESSLLSYYQIDFAAHIQKIFGTYKESASQINMFPTTRLLQACRITLFTRANCSLCTNAKDTLFKVRDTRPFVYREIAVMEDGQKHWKDLYEFDTPVVGLP